MVETRKGASDCDAIPARGLNASCARSRARHYVANRPAFDEATAAIPGSVRAQWRSGDAHPGLGRLVGRCDRAGVVDECGGSCEPRAAARSRAVQRFAELCDLLGARKRQACRARRHPARGRADARAEGLELLGSSPRRREWPRERRPGLAFRCATANRPAAHPARAMMVGRLAKCRRTRRRAGCRRAREEPQTRHNGPKRRRCARGPTVATPGANHCRYTFPVRSATQAEVAGRSSSRSQVRWSSTGAHFFL